MGGYLPNYDTGEVLFAGRGVPYRFAVAAVKERLGERHPAVLRLAQAALPGGSACILDREYLLEALMEQGRRGSFAAMCEGDGVAHEVQCYVDSVRPDIARLFARLGEPGNEHIADAAASPRFLALIRHRMQLDRTGRTSMRGTAEDFARMARNSLHKLDPADPLVGFLKDLDAGTDPADGGHSVH